MLSFYENVEPSLPGLLLTRSLHYLNFISCSTPTFDYDVCAFLYMTASSKLEQAGILKPILIMWRIFSLIFIDKSWLEFRCMSYWKEISWNWLTVSNMNLKWWSYKPIEERREYQPWLGPVYGIKHLLKESRRFSMLFKPSPEKSNMSSWL